MRGRSKGLSSTIGGAIVLFGLLAIMGTSLFSFYLLSEGSMEALRRSAQAERARMEVSLTLNVTGVEERSLTATVRNVGSRAVFLEPGWNDVIVYYKAGDSWSSCLADFSARVRVIGSDTFFQSTHTYINPGEEAVLDASRLRQDRYTGQSIHRSFHRYAYQGVEGSRGEAFPSGRRTGIRCELLRLENCHPPV
jgi:hypothetical protein